MRKEGEIAVTDIETHCKDGTVQMFGYRIKNKQVKGCLGGSFG